MLGKQCFQQQKIQYRSAHQVKRVEEMSFKFLEQFKVCGGKSASELVDEISRAFFQPGKSGRINIDDVTAKGF
jgi:DNA-directed RNA polymerase subunit F